MVFSPLIAGCVTGVFHSPRLFPGVGIIAVSLGGLSRSVYGGRVPRTQRSAPFFTAWCAAEPGPYQAPAFGTPALRSGMKNAAPRPGHEPRDGACGGTG